MVFKLILLGYVIVAGSAGMLGVWFTDLELSTKIMTTLLFMLIWSLPYKAFVHNWKLFRNPDAYDKYKKEKHLEKERKRTTKRTKTYGKTQSAYSNKCNSSNGCCLLAIPMMIFYLPLRVIGSLVKKRY